MAEDEKPIEIEDGAEHAVESDQSTKHPKSEAGWRAHLDRFKIWYTERKKWTIPASVLLLILVLAGIPFSRYALAGLAVKKDLNVKVLDATANTPVSGATVSIGGISAETDGTGKAT